MMPFRERFWFTLAALLIGCPAPQPPHADGDAARAATPENACANAAALGCSSGASAQCATAVAVAIDAGLRPIDLGAAANATTKEAIIKAGFDCQ